QVADAAAHHEPAEPDRSGVPEPDGETMLRERRRHVARGEPAADPTGPALDVDLEVAKVANVEDDPAVRRAVGGATVSAAPDGQLQATLQGNREHRGDVTGVGDAGDRGRAAVEAAVDDRPGGVVVRVAGRDDGAPDARAQRVNGNGRVDGGLDGH